MKQELKVQIFIMFLNNESKNCFSPAVTRGETRTFLLSPLVRSLIRAEPALELLQYTKRIVINPPLIQ